jgi:putative SOS response-associated peptidase YedK
MCERYVIPDQAEVEQEFLPARPWWKFARHFNVAMERNVPVVRTHAGETEGVLLRWGLIPDWAEGDASKGWTGSAPVFGISESKLLSGAWSRGQRCIVPMAGFYAWQMTPARYRQPYFVHLPERALFGVAGVWDRTVSEDDDDVLESCAILCVTSNALLERVNTGAAYMPAILRREDYAAWLGGTPEQAVAALRTYPAEQMAAHPISPRINSLKFNDEFLIQPIEAPVSHGLAVSGW